MSHELLSLRQVREEDRWVLWGWRNSERIRRVSTNDADIPRASHDAWFSRQFPTMHDRTIIVQWKGEPVGWYQIEKWDAASRSGEWGIALGEPNVAIGLGGMLPILALSHAFERIDAQKMTGRVLEINTNVLSIMRRLKIPNLGLDEVVALREDGSCARSHIFEAEQAQWNEILEAGRALVPSTLRESIDHVRASEIPQ